MLDVMLGTYYLPIVLCKLAPSLPIVLTIFKYFSIEHRAQNFDQCDKLNLIKTYCFSGKKNSNFTDISKNIVLLMVNFFSICTHMLPLRLYCLIMIFVIPISVISHFYTETWKLGFLTYIRKTFDGCYYVLYFISSS